MRKEQKKRFLSFFVLIVAVSLIFVGILTLGKEEKEEPKVGGLAPNFQLKNLSGNLIELKAVYKINRVTLVNFWTTWCPPCQKEIPEFARFYSEYKEKGVEILAVNTWDDSSPEQIGEFAKKAGMEFPILSDSNDKVVKSYRIRGVPTTVFIDQTGRIREIFVGIMTYDQLKVRIDKYLPS